MSIDVPRSTTSDLVEEFIFAKIVKGLSANTIRLYRQRLTRFVYWLGDRPIERATVRGYVPYLRKADIEPLTIVGYVRDVSNFCSWLVEEGILTSNPAAKLAPKVPKRLPASYTVD